MWPKSIVTTSLKAIAIMPQRMEIAIREMPITFFISSSFRKRSLLPRDFKALRLEAVPHADVPGGRLDEKDPRVVQTVLAAL